MLLYHRVTPSIQFADTHLYTWVERGTVRVKCFAQEQNTMSLARRTFLEVPKSFCTRKAVAKSQTLWLQSCFIPNTNRGTLQTTCFRRIQLYVCRLTKNRFACPKSFRDFRETGSRVRTRTDRSGVECTLYPLGHCVSKLNFNRIAVILFTCKIKDWLLILSIDSNSSNISFVIDLSCVRVCLG